jgi:hypothetical protein
VLKPFRGTRKPAPAPAAEAPATEPAPAGEAPVGRPRLREVVQA